MSETLPIETVEQPNSLEVTAEKEKASAEEFLIKFQELRTDVRQEAAEALTGIQRRIAQGKNLLSSPKNTILQWRKERAQNKYDRLTRKQDASRFDFVNQRIDRKTKVAYDKLTGHTEAHDAHTQMMAARLETVDTKGNERQEMIDAKRKELVEARTVAIERKLIRQERREQRQKLEARSDEYTYAEREAAINKFIDQADFKKKIRHQAEELLKRRPTLMTSEEENVQWA